MMSLSAKNYPVTSPFGATYSPWSPNSPHLGEDRSMPHRTEVIINGVLVGYAGTTGLSSGVHTHTQKVKDGMVVNPERGGFDVPQPTNVIATGFQNDIGNYIRYMDGEGAVWSIFHFDEVLVKEGDVLIEEDEMYEGHTIEWWAQSAKDATFIANTRLQHLDSIAQSANVYQPNEDKKRDEIIAVIDNCNVESDYDQAGVIDEEPMYRKK